MKINYKVFLNIRVAEFASQNSASMVLIRMAPENGLPKNASLSLTGKAVCL